jgi:hypothetical protein
VRMGFDFGMGRSENSSVSALGAGMRPDASQSIASPRHYERSPGMDFDNLVTSLQNKVLYIYLQDGMRTCNPLCENS